MSRDRPPVVEGWIEEEAEVYLSECLIKLHCVDFDTFQGAIKRFGYRVDLNDEHIKAISQDIMLDYEAFNQTSSSPYSIVYKDDEKFFKDGKHNVPALLKLGFLLCRHRSPQ